MDKRRRSTIKVGVATTDWSGSVTDRRGFPVMGGAGWIRLGQVAEKSRHPWALGKLVVRGKRLAVRSWDGVLHDDCEVIIMQRYMQAEVPDYVRNAVNAGQIVINDVDDHFWQIHPTNRASKVIDPKINKISNHEHYARTLNASSVVTVSSPYLSEVIGQWNENVRLIENCVDVRSFPRRVREHPRKIAIGWCGSTAHRSGDLDLLRPVFAALSNVRYVHVGHYELHPSFASEVGLVDRQVQRVRMLSPKEYPTAFTFDVGVAPLVDIPFNRAKSFIKAIEYAAAGVPYVASDVAEYRRLFDEYGVGRLASTTEEWLAHIEELRDARVRLVEAKRQYQVIAENFDVKKQAKLWDELLWEVVA